MRWNLGSLEKQVRTVQIQFGDDVQGLAAPCYLVRRRTFGRGDDEFGGKVGGVLPRALLEDTRANDSRSACFSKLLGNRLNHDVRALIGIDGDRALQVDILDPHTVYFRQSRRLRRSLGHGFQAENRGKQKGSVVDVVFQVKVPVQRQVSAEDRLHSCGG